MNQNTRRGFRRFGIMALSVLPGMGPLAVTLASKDSKQEKAQNYARQEKDKARDRKIQGRFSAKTGERAEKFTKLVQEQRDAASRIRVAAQEETRSAAEQAQNEALQDLEQAQHDYQEFMAAIKERIAALEASTAALATRFKTNEEADAVQQKALDAAAAMIARNHTMIGRLDRDLSAFSVLPMGKDRKGDVLKQGVIGFGDGDSRVRVSLLDIVQTLLINISTRVVVSTEEPASTLAGFLQVKGASKIRYEGEHVLYTTKVPKEDFPLIEASMFYGSVDGIPVGYTHDAFYYNLDGNKTDPATKIYYAQSQKDGSLSYIVAKDDADATIPEGYTLVARRRKVGHLATGLETKVLIKQALFLATQLKSKGVAVLTPLLAEYVEKYMNLDKDDLNALRAVVSNANAS